MANITQQENLWRIAGDVLMHNANALLSQSDALVMTDSIEIDFSAVTDVDTVALSLMMQWQRRAVASNCTVTFSHLPVNLTSLAELYGVTEFFSTSAQ